jgi:hypothetical protein
MGDSASYTDMDCVGREQSLWGSSITGVWAFIWL